MLTDHVRELIDMAVMVHVKSGGGQAERLRELLIGSHEIAYLDGQLEVINGVDAGLKAHEAIRKASV